MREHKFVLRDLHNLLIAKMSHLCCRTLDCFDTNPYFLSSLSTLLSKQPFPCKFRSTPRKKQNLQAEASFLMETFTG